ncbi:endonuclease dU [Zooshikella harenae]|uniref:DUF99 family protein n=1 Tax=Zooshikella harenae TaxID=2827238 RepID=A0ABS5ZCD5_9GAMM|nr:DUF99 family protein [Zooshikella harenae]MBU2711680.1 DUF99 family protein [Zooshikella harenae]
MRSLEDLLRLNKTIRVVGFDDAPFQKERGCPVNISGIVCAKTRFEGMLWGEATKDGLDSTQVLTKMLTNSKFYPQTHVVLTDGIAIGGFNIIDLPLLSKSLQRPCIAIMRKLPDLERIDKALQVFSDYQLRKKILQRAGKIYAHDKLYFQVAGCSSMTATKVIDKLIDQGNIPEVLRIAHLIGAAVKTGQSSSRA